MIRHIVFFGHSDEAKVRELADMLVAMEDKIEFILDLEVGIDFLRSPRSFDLALSVTLPSREHLGAYAEHPEHLTVVEWVKANGFESKVVDYEL